MIDFEGNAKLADFNVMKNIESSLARTQKGTPLYMAPEVAYGEKYSEKVDIWSLCATFYYIFKSHGPYYNNSVKSSVELMIRKKDVKNYEKLSEFYCGNETLRHVINYNLSHPDEERMSADDIIELLEVEAGGMQLSSLTSEDGQNTIFGRTNGTNFMDETLETQEVNPSQLRKGFNVTEVEKSEYRTNAVSVIEDSKNLDFGKREIDVSQCQVNRKYDALEKNGKIFSSQVDFITAKKVEDTLKESDFRHVGIKPSVISNVSQNSRRRPITSYNPREESPELAVVNISNEEKKLDNMSENDSIEEEFDDYGGDFGYDSSSEDEIKMEVKYEDEKQKMKDKYIFDSMMLERPDDLKEPEMRKIQSENVMKRHEPAQEEDRDDDLMASFLSRTEDDDLIYSKSAMPTPRIFKKSMNKMETAGAELFKKPEEKKRKNYLKNNLIKTGGNDNSDEEFKETNIRKPEEYYDDDFEDYGGFDEEDYLEDFDDEIDDDDEKKNENESLYETQFGKDTVVKTKTYVGKGTQKIGNLFQDFEFIN